MLESLLFMSLMILGGITLLISFLTIVIGLGLKEKKVRNIGFGIGIISAFCFGLLLFYYAVAIPIFNKSQMKDFVGTYKLHNSANELLLEKGLNNKDPKLILYSNGTYEFNELKGLGLEKSGTWETGGIDGHFNFYDDNGNVADFGMPSGSGKNCGLSFRFRSNDDDFFEVERLFFNKIE